MPAKKTTPAPRPPVGGPGPLTVGFRVNFTEADAARLAERAELEGRPVAAMLRRAALVGLDTLEDFPAIGGRKDAAT